MKLLIVKRLLLLLIVPLGTIDALSYMFKNVGAQKCLSYHKHKQNNLYTCGQSGVGMSWDQKTLLAGEMLMGSGNKCLQAGGASEGSEFPTSHQSCSPTNLLQRFRWTNEGFFRLSATQYQSLDLCVAYKNSILILAKCDPEDVSMQWKSLNPSTGQYDFTPPADPTPAPTLAPIIVMPTLQPVTPAPISLDACLEETNNILVGVDKIISDNGNSAEDNNTISSISSFTIAGQHYVIDDFSTNKAHLIQYETACRSKNGNYTQLSYEATCTPSQASEIESTKIVVSQQPKCYATVCTAADYDELFQIDTLEPTETRAEDEIGGKWKCEGAIKTEGISACEMQTLLINSQAGDFVVKSSLDFLAKVTDKKFLFIFDVAEKAVDFTAGDIMEGVCIESGGKLAFYQQKEDNMVKIQCQDPNLDGSKVSAFEVQGLSACLGDSCGLSGEGFANSAMTLAFKEKMVGQEELEKSMVCTITSEAAAVMQASLAVAATVSVSMFLHLF
jgi:hypothetical protein